MYTIHHIFVVNHFSCCRGWTPQFTRSITTSVANTLFLQVISVCWTGWLRHRLVH